MAFPDPGPALDGNLWYGFCIIVSRPAINITVSHIAARPLLLSQASQPISAGSLATRTSKRARGFSPTTTHISIPSLKGRVESHHSTWRQRVKDPQAVLAWHIRKPPLVLQASHAQVRRGAHRQQRVCSQLSRMQWWHMSLWLRPHSAASEPLKEKSVPSGRWPAVCPRASRSRGGGVLRHYDQFGSVAYWLQVLSATTVTV